MAKKEAETESTELLTGAEPDISQPQPTPQAMQIKWQTVQNPSGIEPDVIAMMPHNKEYMVALVLSQRQWSYILDGLRPQGYMGLAVAEFIQLLEQSGVSVDPANALK